MNRLFGGTDKPHLPCLEGMDSAEIAFKLTDTNKDGYIDKTEFIRNVFDPHYQL